MDASQTILERKIRELEQLCASLLKTFKIQEVRLNLIEEYLSNTDLVIQ